MSKLHVQDLTQGSITQKLLVFALPYLFANLIQALYGAVDMIVVGWFDSAAGISAVSIGSQVMQILTSMVAGLTMGSTILIAQYSGARRQEETVRTISTTLTLFALLAVFFTGVQMKQLKLQKILQKKQFLKTQKVRKWIVQLKNLKLKKLQKMIWNLELKPELKVIF